VIYFKMVLNKRYKNDGKSIIYLNKIQKKAIKEFRDKKYELIKKNFCPICNQNIFETLSEKDRYGLPLKVVICKSCGLVFSNPYFNDNSLIKFYNTDSPRIYRSYDSEINNKQRYFQLFFENKIKRGKEIYEFINL